MTEFMMNLKYYFFFCSAINFSYIVAWDVASYNKFTNDSTFQFIQLIRIICISAEAVSLSTSRKYYVSINPLAKVRKKAVD